jgi:hypothetical protein
VIAIDGCMNYLWTASLFGSEFKIVSLLWNLLESFILKRHFITDCIKRMISQSDFINQMIWQSGF